MVNNQVIVFVPKSDRVGLDPFHSWPNFMVGEPPDGIDGIGGWGRGMAWIPPGWQRGKESQSR